MRVLGRAFSWLTVSDVLSLSLSQSLSLCSHRVSPSEHSYQPVSATLTLTLTTLMSSQHYKLLVAPPSELYTK